MKEHIRNWEMKEDDSCLHKHSLECHEGGVFQLDLKLVARCYGAPTTRMITESVHIEELPEENSMNAKSEWTYVRLPRVVVS